ncbi:hypothetical protein BN165_120021 [Clostridioides difficile E1]|nr:hypothetical protein BN163_130021 [Clostridioides difficile T5]CCK90828.1 hypothetical protein BN164_110021 [Clostridioides difficile T20]CCK94848.1 hypothetical protein BN165_120021 [Clostridioides difficile E1]CCK98822.1 hypothetical protein BN166_160009 [Clostridioides difficile E10]
MSNAWSSRARQNKIKKYSAEFIVQQSIFALFTYYSTRYLQI